MVALHPSTGKEEGPGLWCLIASHPSLLSERHCLKRKEWMALEE